MEEKWGRERPLGGTQTSTELLELIAWHRGKQEEKKNRKGTTNQDSGHGSKERRSETGEKLESLFSVCIVELDSQSHGLLSIIEESRPHFIGFEAQGAAARGGVGALQLRRLAPCS